MKRSVFKVVENTSVARDTFKIVLEGDCSAIRGSGQFVQIAIDGLFLRRPISVSDTAGDRLTLIYKNVGRGTSEMTRMNAGDSLDIITGLGNGFNPDACSGTALLIGGSVGAAPLMLLAKELLARGVKLKVALGFNDSSLVFYEDEFKALGAEVAVATMDGSRGVKGVVTDAINLLGHYDYFYCCGPKVMMKALSSALDGPGEFSMEERMGCGTGICYGCTIVTANGPKRVCADGPVFKKEELVW